MSEKKKEGFFSKLLLENPVFGLYLGICSSLAITDTINNALGMGVAVIVVLVLSNIIVSLVRNITPDDILTEGHQKELTTYKGVPISKSHAEKDMFKINLLNMLGK